MTLRLVWALIGLSVFLFGVGQILLTPPFEGFDENAHYGSVQQIAETGTIPRYRIDRVGAQWASYRQNAPTPYATRPPFEDNRAVTYADTFESAETAGRVRAYVNAPPPILADDAPKGPMNWQAQHPPLAYFVLAPVYSATKTLSWKAHIAALRLACWCIAFAGLVMGAVASARYLPATDASWLGLGVLAWPLVSPMFFIEMARLGNDSFCLFFVCVSWAALLRLCAAEPGSRQCFTSAAALGAALGLGALTKAFFLPIAFGVGLFLLARGAHIARQFGQPLPRSALPVITPAAIMSAVFVVLAGAWYLGKLFSTGTLTGANDFVVQSGTGSLSELVAQNFSIFRYLKYLAAIYVSFLWNGTWSMVLLPRPMMAVWGLLFIGIVAAYLWTLLRSKRLSTIYVAPLFLILPMLAGLAYHSFVQTAMGPKGVGTPGYYLHIFAAPLGVMTMLGARVLWARMAGRVWIFAWLTVMSANIAFGQLHQLNMFAGCALKLGDRSDYVPADCFAMPWSLIDRLSVLTYPVAGLAMCVIALGLVFAATWALVLRRGSVQPETAL